MTLVVGTAGHIDHGKTTLLRALTGIDADRLPEERRRGMTIDVGYAHLVLDDGTAIDFVDVPGHDRLVGNMLVGAGEIDAALLVVAADDGPRAQTIEHLALLDALAIERGLVVVTKIDSVDAERVQAVRTDVAALLASTNLAGSAILSASGTTGEGVSAVRAGLVALRDAATPVAIRPATLAIDRAFAVKGRGVVVTGTLRGGPLASGDRMRRIPGDELIRVREVQVHGGSVARVETGGRTALNLAGIELAALHRGDVLTLDRGVVATDRMLVALARPLPDRTRARLHLGTAAVDAVIGRSGRDALALADGTAGSILRLAGPIAARPGDRFVLRRGTAAPVGGVVLDAVPPRGLSRRRQTADRVSALAAAVAHGDLPAIGAARIDLHGLVAERDGARVAPDVATALDDDTVAAVGDETASAAARAAAARSLRRQVTVYRDDAATVAVARIEGLVAAGRLVRSGDRIRRPGLTAPTEDASLAEAMDRLEAALDVAAPPPLAEASRAAGCPPAGVRALEQAGRIVLLDADLAYAAGTYRALSGRAVALATRAPLTPAALRDETGTSRKYVMALLEDLDRRGLLRRTPAGHVPGPKAPAAVRAAGPR
ncbi:MAG TPA: selenocysteine-specific translation elongation factor [Candidatus Saccharimonadales bacterium]|nr:selenocysteine-specific translation elongation factor [Candidatus Saccharimonadales bacterium]